MANLLKIALWAAAAGTSGCTALEVLDYGLAPEDLPYASVAPRRQAPVGAAELARVGGRLRFSSSIPRIAAACVAQLADTELCRDADEDGLSDAWEDLLVDRLRPFVRYHADEPLFSTSDWLDHLTVVALAHVATARSDSSHVRVMLPFLYDKDFGRCSLEPHRGDVERVVFDLAPLGDDSMEVVGLYTAAHEYTVMDGSTLLRGGDLEQMEYRKDEVTGQPRWIVYASAAKHATYATRELCESHGVVPCQQEGCPGASRDDRELLLAVQNAGEPPPAPVWNPFGVGMDLWGDSLFCGFAAPSNSSNEPCAPPLAEKLLKDPFEPAQR